MSSLDMLASRQPGQKLESPEDARPPADEPALGPVLIVDDEEPIAEALAMIVGEAGYHAEVARHGREALASARARWPALVITDLMMPYLDGASLIVALRAEAERGSRPRASVVVMTASSSAIVHAVGADAILRKPFDLDDVERLLRRFLPKPE